MIFASVILDIPTQALDTVYTYSVPECVMLGDASDCAYGIQIGCAVLVPFGGRQAIGFVMALQELPDDVYPNNVNPEKLKAVIRVVSRPFFDEEGAACALWMARHYVAPLSACVRLFTPPGGIPRMVKTQGPRGSYWRLEQPTVAQIDDRWVAPGPAFDTFQPKKNAVKQAAIVNALRGGELRVAELTAEYGKVAASLKVLEKQGVVRIFCRRRMRGMEDAHEISELPFKPSTKPCLTQGQCQALDVINNAALMNAGQVVVVDGVTGSGKTEVYLQAIEEVLQRGRTACVLVPEISLTPQTVARFRGRFGDTVAVMHSRMSAGERFDQWDFIRSGRAHVVVGARSALFTPLKNLGIIVIDEEHEGSYKQDSAPRYHARDVACWMAQRSGAVVVLGSATPSIEALYGCAKRGWQQVCLPQRANGKALPPVEVLDMAKEFASGSRAMFSGRLLRALQTELAAGHKAVLLLNQRGFAKFLLCRECGFVPECPSCSTSLTFHEVGLKLVCHHCGYTVSAPVVCPECGSPYLKKFGAGTQRVEAELRALLNDMPGVGSGVPIIRMDADTTAGKGAHQRLLEQFASAQAAILLGTQMIAKGLDFEDVTLVAVINADTQLHLPDYRAGERTFSLIQQVAGRAGRAELPGRVMVQTYAADNVAIRAAACYDRAMFLKQELPKRRLLGYPPYIRMANVLVWGSSEEAVMQEAQELQIQLQQQVRDYGNSDWIVLPAGPCLLSKLRNTYRWHVLIKCSPESDLSGVLEPFFRSRKVNKEVHVAVDVDPSDLF